MDGQRYAMRAQVHTIGGYSAHADQIGLLGFVTRMRHWPSQVRIVHGDLIAKQALAQVIRARYEQVSRRCDLLIAGSEPARGTAFFCSES